MMIVYSFVVIKCLEQLVVEKDALVVNQQVAVLRNADAVTPARERNLANRRVNIVY